MSPPSKENRLPGMSIRLCSIRRTFEGEILKPKQYERNSNGNSTNARARTTTSESLRSAPRNAATPGTRLVSAELHRRNVRRGDENRGPRNRTRHVRGNGDWLLGTGLRAAQSWSSP